MLLPTMSDVSACYVRAGNGAHLVKVYEMPKNLHIFNFIPVVPIIYEGF